MLVRFGADQLVQRSRQQRHQPEWPYAGGASPLLFEADPLLLLIDAKVRSHFGLKQRLARRPCRPCPTSSSAANRTNCPMPGLQDSYSRRLQLASGTTITTARPIVINPQAFSINGINASQGAITIDGGSTSDTTCDRIFFVGVLAGTPATAGGTGRGGTGLDGAIFVNARNLSVSGVTLPGNRAVGGAEAAQARSEGTAGRWRQVKSALEHLSLAGDSIP